MTQRRAAGDERRLASVGTAAEIYDVNPRTVRRWIAEGKITGYRVGSRLLKVDLAELEEKIIRVIPAGGSAHTNAPRRNSSGRPCHSAPVSPSAGR